MEVTVGLIMFITGLSGCFISLMLLPILGKIFGNQRKNLMKKLEKEI